MPPLPLSPGAPGIPGGPLDPNDPTNFMRSILDAQNRQRIWDTMGGLATGLIRASAPSREPQDLFGSAVAGALEGDKGGEDRGLKRAMTGLQLMQGSAEMQRQNLIRNMFMPAGGDPSGGATPSATDRGGWPASSAGPASGGDQSYASAVRGLESRGGRMVPNELGSGAFGPYQFMPKTWADVRGANPALGLPEDMTQATPEQHASAFQQFTAGNAAALQKAGIPPTPDNLYLAHRFGAEGAAAVVKANPDTPLAQILPLDWQAQNPDMRGQTAGGFRRLAAERMQGVQQGGPSGAGPQQGGATPVQFAPPGGSPQPQSPGTPAAGPTNPTLQQVIAAIPIGQRMRMAAMKPDDALKALAPYSDPKMVPALDIASGRVVFAPEHELGSGRYAPVDAARLALETKREAREAMNAKIVTRPDGKPAMNQPLYEFEKGIDAQRLELEKKKVPSEITRNESQNQNQPLLPDGRPNPAFIGTQGEIEAAKAKAAADAKMGVEAATALTTARVKDFEDNQRPKALAASQELNEIYQARQLLRAGAVTGTGAEARAWLENLKASVGWPSGQSVNTPAFVGAMANRVLGAIKTLGANPSNADRDYMEKAKGGSIAYSEQAIERLLEIGERAARQALATYNAEAGRMKKMRGVTEAFAPDHFDVAEPPPYEKWAQSNPLKAVTPQSLTPSAIDQEIERRRRGR